MVLALTVLYLTASRPFYDIPEMAFNLKTAVAVTLQSWGDKLLS